MMSSLSMPVILHDAAANSTKSYNNQQITTAADQPQQARLSLSFSVLLSTLHDVPLRQHCHIGLVV